MPPARKSSNPNRTGTFAMPAWLSPDAPHADVVLSSRVRFMRNLRGYKFVHQASESDLLDIRTAIVDSSPNNLQTFRHLTQAEHQHLVGSRLMSPEFRYDAPGRAILLDTEQTSSVMVNEEDHLRIQALTGGWTASTAEALADAMLSKFQETLEFAWSPNFGNLAASPYNAGEGRRMSAMFHLIGLAHTKRLPNVLKALGIKGIASRGLFGEASRAVGAFMQVSITDARRTDFIGACEYLISEERIARREVGRDELAERAKLAIDFAIGSPVISVADAFRVLGWARWAAVAGIDLAPYHSREVDLWLTTIELKGGEENEDRSGRARAAYLRSCIETT